VLKLPGRCVLEYGGQVPGGCLLSDGQNSLTTQKV